MIKLKITEIINNYSSSYGTNRNWQKLCEKFMNDETERNIVEKLIIELEKYGDFREPIVLITSDDSSYDNYVANGTHRLIASMLKGKTHINCVIDHVETEHNNVITIVKSTTSLEGFLEKFLKNYRSFKVSEEYWATVESVSCNWVSEQYNMEISWGEKYDEKNTPLLVDKLFEIFAKSGGYPITIESYSKSDYGKQYFY